MLFCHLTFIWLESQISRSQLLYGRVNNVLLIFCQWDNKLLTHWQIIAVDKPHSSQLLLLQTCLLTADLNSQFSLFLRLKRNMLQILIFLKATYENVSFIESACNGLIIVIIFLLLLCMFQNNKPEWEMLLVLLNMSSIDYNDFSPIQCYIYFQFNNILISCSNDCCVISQSNL